MFEKRALKSKDLSFLSWLARQMVVKWDGFVQEINNVDSLFYFFSKEVQRCSLNLDNNGNNNNPPPKKGKGVGDDNSQ
jgi:hypothetical protein